MTAIKRVYVRIPKKGETFMLTINVSYKKDVNVKSLFKIIYLTQ